MSAVYFERVFAAIAFAVCLALAVRLAVGGRRRRALDAAALRLWLRMRHGALSVWHWRDARRNAEHARKLADEAIRRARGRVDRDGNVYSPKSFRKPPRDKMH